MGWKEQKSLKTPENQSDGTKILNKSSEVNDSETVN